MTKFLEAYREPKGVQDKPAKLHPAKAEPPSSEVLTQPEFLSADVTIAEPAVTPRHDEPVTPHTGGPVPGALSDGPAIPGAVGATSVGGPNGPTPLTYSDGDLKENIVQVGALIGISADQPLVLADVGAHRHEQSETDFTWNVGMKRADLLTVAALRNYLAPVLLTTAALALSAVGITINGWFARSLGSSDLAGWLFLAVGVAADLAALVLPSAAAGLWHTGQRATALVGWVVWFVTFVFAVTAGIGFASTNISDVTLARASRVTPAITSTQAMLSDAMAARDRECKDGIGKFCREREALVAERRQLFDAAMTSVGQVADPQTDAAIKLVAWVSRGMMRPAPEDFAMVRLILLALLPQIGGMLLLIRRRSVSPAPQPTLNCFTSRLGGGMSTTTCR